MKYTILIVTTLLVAFAGLTAQAFQLDHAGYEQQKVVYHFNFDNEKRQIAGLRNIQNHINATGGDNLDLRVVMHGNGISLMETALSDPDVQTRIDSLKLQGVEFNVCANTLRGRDIDFETDLYDVLESDIVPSGVAEIAHLQSQGYSYIRP